MTATGCFRRSILAALAAFALPCCASAAAVGTGPVGDDDGRRLACTGLQPASPAVLCVRAGAASGGNGAAAAPFATVQSAIDAARAGDIVQVAAGTYAENLVIGAFNIPSSKALTLLGGFAPDFASRDAGTHRSVIDGNLLAPVVQLHIDSPADTTLDGFEITRGRGLGTTYEDGYGHGGGVYAVNYGDGAIVISHNHIHSNRSNEHTTRDSRGGGIHAAVAGFATDSGTMRIEDNRVLGNLAGKGAGINVAGRHASILRNRVQDNITHGDHGGGIYVSTGVTEVRQNIIAGNEVGASAGYGWGAGIIIAAAAADLEGNLITDNYTPSAGAGVFWDEGATGTMRNDLIVRNRCPNDARSGAAIYLDGGPGGPSMVTAFHLTIADHLCPATAPNGGAVIVEAGSHIDLRNAIFWGNSRDFATLSGGTFAIAHSITQAAGSGNINVDPRFADAAGLDYHVRSAAGRHTPSGWVSDAVTSPAVDGGDPASAYASEPQPNGGRVNLGAYGNTAEASRSPDGIGDAIFASGFEP